MPVFSFYFKQKYAGHLEEKMNRETDTLKIYFIKVQNSFNLLYLGSEKLKTNNSPILVKFWNHETLNLSLTEAHGLYNKIQFQRFSVKQFYLFQLNISNCFVFKTEQWYSTKWKLIFLTKKYDSYEDAVWDNERTDLLTVKAETLLMTVQC